MNQEHDNRNNKNFGILVCFVFFLGLLAVSIVAGVNGYKRELGKREKHQLQCVGYNYKLKSYDDTVEVHYKAVLSYIHYLDTVTVQDAKPNRQAYKDSLVSLTNKIGVWVDYMNRRYRSTDSIIYNKCY